MAEEHLEKLNISSSGELKLKHESRSRAVATDSVGEGEHWSSDGLYRHLCVLEGLVPRKVSMLDVESEESFIKACRQNEAAARLWIESFFYRVAFMSPRASKLVLNIEHNVPPIPSSPLSRNSLSGFVDFTAILTSAGHARGPRTSSARVPCSLVFGRAPLATSRAREIHSRGSRLLRRRSEGTRSDT